MDGLTAHAGQSAPSRQTITTPYFVVDNFLPAELAWAMRRDIESHFAEPYRHEAETHQIWNYWFVPGLYTYLRTTPEKIFQQNRMPRFFEALRGWSETNLGLRTISWPYLSLYLAGCRQNLHNDSVNGRIAYVYSLTSDARRTEGGQTLVFNDADPFRGNLRAPAAGSSFYTAIEPSFNRLVLFDDRMPHAVEQLIGSMDPLDGRFVMHGHISESPPLVEGALVSEVALPLVGEVVNEVFTAGPDFMSLYHGPLSLRIDVASTGTVADVHALLNRVVAIRQGEESFDFVLDLLLEKIRKIIFPQATEGTKIILPIMMGGLLPSIAAAQGAAR